jgi:hypothetical protein
MKKHKNRIAAGMMLLTFLIVVNVVPAMAEEPNITLNPIQPTTAGSLKQISWSYIGVFEPPNATLELFNDGILNRTIVSETPLESSYYWAIPLSLEGLYQIKITASTTTGQELTNTTDIELTTPTQQGCRYCHTTTGTNNSGVYDNTVGSVTTRHHSLITRSVINPLTNVPFDCENCHPIINGGMLIERNCLNCHNGTAFWANPLKINPGEPHLNITAPPTPTPTPTPTPLPPNIIITFPVTGDNWIRGTTQTIIWTYTGDLGSSAIVELLEHGIVKQTWNDVPQSNGVGSYDWAIPSKFKVSTYQIRVSAGGYSNTTGNFNIVRR